MEGDAMTKPTVFISYSHKDEYWKDRLLTHLGVLQQEGLLDLWDDRRIGAGEDWYQKIKEAIAKARVAVLLVSADFLTSDFILNEEVPRLLELQNKEGLRIFPVVIRPCAWKHVKWLARMNLRPRDGKPISSGDEHHIDADLAAIADEVAAIIKSVPPKTPLETSPTAPEKIETHMPSSGSDQSEHNIKSEITELEMQRVRDLADNIKKDLDLLKKFEDALRLEDDPRRRTRYSTDIEQLRESSASYQREYAELQSPKVEIPSAAMLNVADHLQQLDTKLNRIADERTLHVSLAKLPSTNPELFGREKELAILDAAWANPRTNIVSLVAWGGVGKTALVNTWLGKMHHNYFRGAERVFGWSFFSQGAAEAKQASADEFIASALKWFGDSKPDEGSPWEKGERLAECISKQKTLLILDGMEPLQHPLKEGEGDIRDPGLQSLVRELANHNPGLCVITTRLDVDDLKGFTGTTVENRHLEDLSSEAGIQLLRHLGVNGVNDEIKQAVRDFEGHALALMLLGTYLSIVYNGDVQKRDLISRLTKERKYGGHARQMMESYEAWFKDQPELDILRMMGLFDRPAESGAIEALRAAPPIGGRTSTLKVLSMNVLRMVGLFDRAAPPIEGLTSKLKDLSPGDWQFALNNLRKAGLLAKEDPVMPDALDCHSLIREHFGEKLKGNNPEAWKEAHNRLYEYFKNQAEEYPDTIEEMSPLYAAVAHGCQAGMYQEALDEVYWPRIQRKNEFFNLDKLGAIGADLVAISGFFDSLWDKPVAQLTEDNKAFVLNEAGCDLRALGRLKEAAQPMKAGLKAYIAQEKLEYPAIVVGNISELNLTTGDIAQAQEYAKQSVDLADRSGDVLERMRSRTILADALHQAANQSEAESLFREAEEMQKEDQPEYPFLYSLGGFRYCDLLMSQEKYHEVLNRAVQTIEWESGRLLDIALDHLSLGRAHLLQVLQEGSQDFTPAKEHLNQAVNGLRQAGVQDYLSRGLLARAELYRAQGKFDKAQHDLDETMTIAKRGEMGLHQADCHLEYARLYLAMGRNEDARKCLDTAREMVDEMGYHRRDKDIVEIEAQL